MKAETYTLLDKVNQIRENQKDWLKRCKEKGIDMSWKAHLIKKRPLNFVPMNAYKNSKQAWLEDFC